MRKIRTPLLVLIVLCFLVYAKLGVEKISTIATIISDAVGDISEEMKDTNTITTGSVVDADEAPMGNAGKRKDAVMDADGTLSTGDTLVGATNKEAGSIGTLEDLGDAYSLYTSNALGISLKVPKKISVSYCDGKEVVSDIVVFEDYTSTYIGPNALYDATTCEKTAVTGLSLMQANESWIWKITPQSVDDKDDLNAVAKTVYNSEGCTIKDFVDTGLGDTQNIVMNTTGPEIEDGEPCFLNYKSVFKYSPSSNIYVWWSGGQDVAFRLLSDVYDDVMIDSLQFVK